MQQVKPQAGIDFIGVCIPFFCYDGNGKFLFNLRGENCRDEVGRWDIGAEQLEYNESFEDAVRRGVREEYGCDCTLVSQLKPVNIIRNTESGSTHWIAISHIVLVDPKEVKNNEPHKFTEIGWFSIDNLPEPLHSGLAQQLEHHKDILRFFIMTRDDDYDQET